MLLRTFHFALGRQIEDAQLCGSQAVRHRTRANVGGAIAVYNEILLQEVHGQYNVEVENGKFTTSAVKGGVAQSGRERELQIVSD